MTLKPARLFLWFVLAIPAIIMTYDMVSGDALLMDMLHPSGEMSIRLIILALLPGSLADFFGHTRFLKAWISIRRNLGVAAFLYGLFHLIIYLVDMQMLSAIIEELSLPAILTGWLALLCLTIPAAISFDKAMRRLGRRWKQLQMLVYPALILTLAHWLLLDWEWAPALIHLAPLLVAWTLRLIGKNKRKYGKRLAT